VWGGLWLLFAAALVIALRRPESEGDATVLDRIEERNGDEQAPQMTATPRPNNSLQRGRDG
jgi:hypothetical protein